MHLPINFGSALQTFALQRTIEGLGYDAQIIDYVYPNKIHKGHFSFKSFIVKTISFLFNALGLFPNRRQRYKYKAFYKKYYKLSDKRFNTMSELHSTPPVFDIYMTGSDQVWNSNFVGEDTSFLLSFAPKVSLKISYSSSFAVDYVRDDYKEKYSELLKQYTFIGVREQNSIHLVKKLTGKSATLVCDPTLLLTKDEWMTLACEANINIPERYILVYILTYSFNPYPYVDGIIDKVQQQTGLKAIYINGSKHDYFKKNTKVVKAAGPLEFLKLFANASFVITTSFHGVAYAVNFGIPFYGIVKKGNRDTRIVSLLNICGLEDRAVVYDEDNLPPLEYDMNTAKSKLTEFREYSLNYLSKSLEQL